MPTILPLQAALEPAGRAHLSAILAAGGVAAIPTESSYALAVSPFHEGALRTLFDTKGRSERKPLLVLIGALSQLSSLVSDVPPPAELLHHTFWPGPLTIVFPASPSLPALLTAGTGTIGIRQPALPPLCELLAHVGPLTGTSANRSGHPPLCRAEDLRVHLGDDVDIIVEAGTTPGGLPSTVIDGRAPVRVLREGAIPRAALRTRLRDGNFELCP
jgi:L-threonylcarbamoyladenylate synthase